MGGNAIPRVLLSLALTLLRCRVISGQTTVPIFLPDYGPDDWSILQGSIIGQDETATTYTIFCAPQTPPACEVDLEFPFIFTEGPSTLEFYGTVTSTFTNNLECRLEGTTAALCSGYSSLRAGYSVGMHTGPTEFSWTSSLAGTDVQWAPLTIVDDAAAAEVTPAGATPQETAGTGQSSGSGVPVQTGTSAACRSAAGTAPAVTVFAALLLAFVA